MGGRAFRRLREEKKKALPACSHAGFARGLKENRLAEKKGNVCGHTKEISHIHGYVRYVLKSETKKRNELKTIPPKRAKRA